MYHPPERLQGKQDSRGFSFRLTLLLAALSLCAVVLAVFGAPPARAASPLKLGVGIENMSAVDAFDRAIGYRTDIYLIYTGIGAPFYADDVRPLAQSGHIIQLSWEPWDPFSPLGRNQPAYRLRNITRGDFDADIRRWARDLRDFGYPVRIRPMCEMNGDWTSWSGTVNGNTPADFVPAWRHIHDIFAQEGATNVSWVWSPNRDGSIAAAQNTFNTYYPGDGYVDYIGMSGYNWGNMYNTPNWTSVWQSFGEVFGYSYYVFSGATSKPLMVSEMGSTESGGNKAAWITDAYAELAAYFPRFESVTWFNYLKEADWRAESSPASFAAFRAGAMSLDDGPPSVSFKSPANGATLSGNRTVSLNAADDNAVSRVDLYADETLVGTATAAPYDISLATRALADGRYTLSAVAYDYAGNSTSSQVNVTLSNSTDREYTFNWYDSASAGMQSWIVVGNPGTTQQHVEIYLSGALLGAFDVPAGGRVTPMFSGRIGGPVKVVSTGGGKLLVSQRSLYNGNFAELAASVDGDISDEEYLTWYDEQSTGMRSWLMIGNQSDSPADVEVSIAGQPLGTFHVPSGGVITPEFPGVMNGPVRVRSQGGQRLSVSQRIIYAGSFNENPARPASALTTEYVFPWYDDAYMFSWVLVNNIGADTASVRIEIGGRTAGNFSIPAGGTISPRFFDVVDGPVRVVSENGQPLMASIRSLFGNSMEEKNGSAPSALAGSQWFGWYDSLTAGMTTWLLVANPNSQTVNVSVRTGNRAATSYTIPPGGRITPVYPGLMDGPMEIKEASGRSLLVSQRVIYRNSFSELGGTVLN